MDTDLNIGVELTERQQAYVGRLVRERYAALKKNTQLQRLSVEAIVDSIQAELKNPHAFKKAQNHFIHKLNTIVAEAIKNNWIPPLSRSPQQPTSEFFAEEQKIKQLKIKIQGLMIERQGFVSDLETLQKNDPDAEVELIQSYQHEIAKYDKQLQGLIHEHKHYVQQ